MNTRKRTKMLHEGNYAAEVDIDLLYTDDKWAPYLSLQDAYKLDEVRSALRIGDIATASLHSRVYALTRVAG